MVLENAEDDFMAAPPAPRKSFLFKLRLHARICEVMLRK
jgi:hypothetical protein